VWAIGPEDELANLTSYTQQLGLTYPVLYDPEGLEAHANYVIDFKTTNSVYPQDWIVGVDGRVRYVSASYEPAAMIAVLEEELAKLP
jgi:peroxiredoxin